MWYENLIYLEGGWNECTSGGPNIVGCGNPRNHLSSFFVISSMQLSMCSFFSQCSYSQLASCGRRGPHYLSSYTYLHRHRERLTHKHKHTYKPFCVLQTEHYLQWHPYTCTIEQNLRFVISSTLRALSRSSRTFF